MAVFIKNFLQNLYFENISEIREKYIWKKWPRYLRWFLTLTGNSDL